MGCRIGIDVGGTFTDFVLVDGNTGATSFHKEPSRPDRPTDAVTAGIERLIAATGRAVSDVELVVHGTTLALNAIIQRSGGRVGLVVSEGFGDMMVIGRGALPNRLSYKEPKRVPIVPRDRVFEIAARLRPDGSVLASPGEADLDAVAARARAAEIEALAVLVINSYAHPSLEIAVAEGLGRRLPGVLVTASAALWPEIREYERALVTALNAYVHPLMARHYGGLAAGLRGLGIAAPISVTTSTGGSVGVETARERPIDTLLSGPAAGVVAAARLAAEIGLDRIVTFDMGGTSSDIAILADGAPELTMETRVGELPVIAPAIHVWAIGAGGGSVLWVDEQGVLKVGPRSAGSDPGPVAYGRGGTEPTVTDCYLALGILDPGAFLGGRMPLDRDAAIDALARTGGRIGIVGPDAAIRTAAAAMRIATARMATEISKGMAQRGLDPAGFTLMPFGGAGPAQACQLAEEARLARIVVPPSPGTFCARGAILAPIQRDFARSRRLTLGIDADAGEALRAIVLDLEREARAWTAGEGALAGAVTVLVSADMQYPRTATERTVRLGEQVWRSGDPQAIANLFHADHERLYGFRDLTSPVDVTTIRLRVLGTLPAAGLPEQPTAAEAPRATGSRNIHWRDGWVAAALYPEGALGPRSAIDGPALIQADLSTIWIAPGWRAAADRFGALHLERMGAAA